MTNPVTGEDHNNAEKRRRLKSIYIEKAFEFEYIQEKLPTSGQTRLKKTEQAIKKCLPQYEYFLADSPLSESDSTIQKYFKDMAFQVIQNQVDTNVLEQTVITQLQSVLSGITEKINAVVPESEQVKAKIDFDWSKLITTGFESDGSEGSIPLSARGDGFRRITMMSYFEYLAEEKHSDHQNIIFAFEEPETFLHPSAQENLFEKLNDISSAGYQVFMTTHSPVLVSKTQREDLHHIYKEQGNYQLNSNVTNYKEIADDLGVTVDNQFVSMFDNAKCLLLVEGVDDCNAFSHVSKIYHENGLNCKPLDDIGVVAIPVGGCGSIKHWVSLDLLTTLNKPFYIFLDSDKEAEQGNSPNADKLVEYGFVEGENFSVTRKREIENYISPEALERLAPGCGITFTDWCDVKGKAKQNDMRVALGGKKVANKHFSSLRFEELVSTFNPNGDDDEFLGLYNKLAELVKEA
ncbi:AAA family ATPase [uncultured Psychromonas sp.]|uniref:ATP-dependent nuclease n=1 Tax=uncultured Psychromonas sp. TaxID=173974 RepID=UPI00262AF20E|nr:AAA family ATPase [uncultured Psychromonas sp.]